MLAVRRRTGRSVAVLVDTAALAAPDRLDAVVATVGQAVQAPRFAFEGGAERMRFRMDVHALGPLTITRTTSTGLRLDLPSALLDSAAPPAVALMLHGRAASTFDQHGRQQRVRRGDALLNDLTSPYSFGWSGTGSSSAVVVDVDQLALPVDAVRRAAQRDLRSSALVDVVLGHLRDVVRQADALCADPAAAVLVRTATELLRALVADAAGVVAAPTAATEGALLARVLEHVRQHLGDPDLTPARVARAHHISLRRLYELCSRADLSLAEWTMSQRLDGARRDLADPALQRLPIARTASRWGFVDAGHFSRRFRQAYGVTPRDWRALHAPVSVPVLHVPVQARRRSPEGARS